ncbi:polymer-forming cytoskeletal protein [Aquibacillus koreensis]|uniref:Polymer-forming cytoskeletal protein n=1 Tax=Aquibacillus koreensis TaxID=279446 RepID=A0A9X3WSV4_9BACI|nr:polymer-forming cytoskeletal protein [Aquibacillus koreensis]MCT2536963.1 polymer-forming cytoskeletal protein [Aquibacillus koreensis]MDC3422734.1 polymer-forming cytoskeletal protein [Aquibacillus koreensis]
MKSKNKKLDTLDTIIGATTSLGGTIHSEGSMRIEGKVKGEIQCAGDLTVGAGGLVEADVHARNIIIAGTIAGEVIATGKIHIESKGRLKGNVKMESFVIDEGGIFEGNSNMKQEEVQEKKEQNKIETVAN